MKKTYGFLIFVVAIFLFSLLTSSASAATLFATPASGTHGLQQTFSVNVKIDSKSEGINAAQARVTFPATILEVKSIDTSGSIFGFWPENPSFSNMKGTVDFIGGALSGVSGASLHVITIVFNTKSVGSAPISFDNAAITVDDGTGINVLTGTSGASVTVSASVIAPPLTPTPAPPVSVPSSATSTAPVVQAPIIPQIILPLPGEPIPAPIIITRKPEIAKKLPIIPNVVVPLYPSAESWYNVSTPFNATWDLPLDITDVATAIDSNPNFAPQKSEKLFDNKIFDSLPESISYLHVRFKNNVGWGPTAHYRLAIDITPPTPFTLESINGFETDEPAPTFQFESSDALSGVRSYFIKIGDAEEFESVGGRVKLPLLPPGKRNVLVRAVDFAGNGISAHGMLTTIPIASPVIIFVTEKVFFETDEGVTVKGTALPNITARVLLTKENGELIAEHETLTDNNGNWSFVFSEALGVGKYKVSAQARDVRGALSLVVDSTTMILVKSQPIIKMGALEIGAGGSAIILLVIIIGGFGAGYWYFRMRQRKISADVMITSRDQEQLYVLLNKDIEKITKDFDVLNDEERKFILNRVHENVQKIEKYILKEIRNIGE